MRSILLFLKKAVMENLLAFLNKECQNMSEKSLEFNMKIIVFRKKIKQRMPLAN